MGAECCPCRGGGTLQQLGGCSPCSSCSPSCCPAQGEALGTVRAETSQFPLDQGPRCSLGRREAAGPRSCCELALGAGDVRAVNDSGLLHEGLLFFFFLSPWRIFFPSSPAVLLRKGIFRTKLPPCPPVKAARLGVCVCCSLSNVTRHLHTHILCLALAGTCCSFLFPFYSAW